MPPERELGVVGAVGLLAGHRHRPRVGPGRRQLPGQAKHPPALARLAVGGGELLQGVVGVGPAGAGPRKLPHPIPGRLVQEGAEPVALGPQLPSRQRSQVQAAGGVDRQRLSTAPGESLGELGVAVGRLPVGQVEFGWPLGFGADHHIQPGVVPGPGQLHIQPVAVLGAGEPDQRPPPRQPLGTMPGGGIGQVDPAVALAALPAVQVPAGQGHFLAVAAVHADSECPSVGVEGGDGAAGAVGHPQLSDGVAATHHPVPDRHLEVLDLKAIGAKAAAGGQQLLASGVQPIDLASAARQYDRVLGRVGLGVLPALPPVVEQRQSGGRLGLGRHYPVMGPIGGHRLRHQPTPDQLQGLAFPGLLLAAVLGQLRGAKAVAEGTEPAAGVDRRQLPVIANQHHLGLGLLGVLEQASQLAAAEHARFVDDQHRPGADSLGAAV
jgi:hypothetical protein